MPTITKKQLEEYEQLRCDRDNGRLLTPDGLRFICEANNLDPEAIGKHILEVYGKFKAQKLIYRKAGYSKKFREEHEEEILLHQAAKKAFDEMGVKKLPKVKELQIEYAKLLEEKDLCRVPAFP